MCKLLQWGGLGVYAAGLGVYAAGLGVYAAGLGVYAIHVIIMPLRAPAYHLRC